ncbi:MOSC domain-containing protein [Blastopirellula marina]|uniref:MOSC domain-containing protein n=1 Tax=Blastopirellula marina TaxID=124 RepID=A0A2S8F4M1_9BACT|nr:MOSC domain-containing protein [Blastopirellula marina]PQO27109.1 MOSC domain-containing protein [Blastopirellula marina]PTL41256.1 MOSC domain-containing protein [Blastopirellula marina]
MSEPGIIVQLAVGMPQDYGDPTATDPLDKPWSTGFFKQPVSGAVPLKTLGFDGDGVADAVNHGGPDKAVLCYSAEHYPIWREEFRQIDSIAQRIAIDEFGPGAFGENLTIQGQAEDQVCLGDIFEVGTARIQVSQPRQPCWKLGRRWRMKQLTALAVSTGRMGWYVRILQEGEVSAGQEVRLIERPLADWPIARLNELFYHDRHNVQDAQTMADCPILAEAWRGEFRKRVEKSAS